MKNYVKMAPSNFRLLMVLAGLFLSASLISYVYLYYNTLTTNPSTYRSLEVTCNDDNRSPTKPKPFTFPVGPNFKKSNFTFTMRGAVPNFDDLKEHAPHLLEKVEVTTSVLFEFSPLVNEHVRQMFASITENEADEEAVNQQFRVYPFQVSCSPEAETGLLLCALRTWLHNGARNTNVWQKDNKYLDSYLYVLRLDHDLRYVNGSGQLANIPSTIQDAIYSGPEDPRVFTLNGETIINFLNVHNYPEGVGKRQFRRQFLWHVQDNTVSTLKSPQPQRLEKNWAPWPVNGTLNFVYQFIPITRVLQCNYNRSTAKLGRKKISTCYFASRDQVPSQVVDSAMNLPWYDYFLRGGSPVVHYSGNFYLTITHSWQTQVSAQNGTIHFGGGLVYASQLVLMHVEHSLQFAFASTPIFIEPAKMLAMRTCGGSIVRPFLYSRSVYVENPDSLVLAAGLNDKASFIIRIIGVESLLKNAMEKYGQIVSSGVNSASRNAANVEVAKWLATENVIEISKYFSNNSENEYDF